MKPYYTILKDLREDKDLTQKQLAGILGISTQYYSRYELGQVELPIRHLKTLCNFYKKSADYILNIPPFRGPTHRGSTTKK